MSNRARRSGKRRPETRPKKQAQASRSRRLPPSKLPTKAHLRFGRNVRRLRLRKGLTLVQLAADCRLKAVRLEHLEAGMLDATLATAARLAKRLGVSLSQIYSGIKP